MTATQYQFLEERISPFRGEFMPVVARNVSELLKAFDDVVLGGFSPVKDRQ